MKATTLIIVTLVAHFQLQAQSIGIGTNTPHASAQLDVTSTNRGLLAPRMTTSQRNAIASPAKGLLVYDTNLNNLYHYNGSSWAAVGAGGSFTLPYNQTLNIEGAALNISNVGSAIIASAIKGSTAAIDASSSAIGGYGVLGSNHEAAGFGTAGFSASGTGIYGFSAGGGTALKGISLSGYGLSVSGNLKFNGGNTSPSAGAVLTSVDASGNAVWKQPAKVAFRATGIYPGLNVLPNFAVRKLHFPSEQYDYANSFEITSSAIPTTDMSNFVAPVTGLYHFEVAFSVQLSSTSDDFTELSASIMIKRGANIIHMARGRTPCCEPQGFGSSLHVSTDYRLLAGDDVYVEVRQTNDAAAGATISNTSFDTYFCGTLIMAD